MAFAAAAWAQAPGGAPRIGLLSFGTAPAGGSADPVESFVQGLRDHGYLDQRNVVLERRYADGKPERLAALAAELVQSKVTVIVAGGPGPMHAARAATATIPIVVIGGSDPVREGWAQSLARPGGNMTGLTVTFPELGPKRLEVLKEALPGIERVALLFSPAEILDSSQAVEEVQAAARSLGLRLLPLEVRAPQDLDGAFDAARRGRAQALVVWATNLLVTHRARVVELAAADRLPTISDFPLLAHSGFLLTYGADLDDLARRAGSYVDRILKGARPGELPIERPTKLRLIVNLKTARALGVTIAPLLLQRADEVIE